MTDKTALVALRRDISVVLQSVDGDPLDRIRKIVDETPTDASTEANREAIRTAAYTITREKTALDKAGLALTESARATIKAVNAERNTIEERLTEIRDHVRKPLTDYETAEKERAAAHERIIVTMEAFGLSAPGCEDVDLLTDQIRQVQETRSRDWQEFAGRGATMADHVEGILTRRVEGIRKAAAEREELERLRAAEAERQREQAERDRVEREARIAREAADSARAEAEAAAERSAAAAAEAAERERVRHAAEIQREQERAAEAERRAHQAAGAERERIAAEQRAEDAARVKRERDKKHRGAVNVAARDALMQSTVPPLSEGTATQIIQAIVRGEIPRVTISY